jgi:hypothetical protein
MHAQLPLAFWSPWAIVLVSAFIVAFPLVPTVWFYSRTVERRTGGDGGTDAVLAGRSERTPFVLVGWIGIVLGIAVVIGVAIAVAAQRLTDDHPGNPTRGPQVTTSDSAAGSLVSVVRRHHDVTARVR